jgi:ribosomal protein L40E
MPGLAFARCDSGAEAGQDLREIAPQLHRRVFLEGYAETILKIEGGYVLQQKGGEKHVFNPPTGTLVLTDRRFIFAQSDVGLAERAMAGSVGLVIGSEVLRVMSTVKPEQLNKTFEKPESFYVNLTDILEVKAERQLTSAGLIVKWNASGEMKASFYKTGMITGLGLPNEWVEAINTAKQRQLTSRDAAASSTEPDTEFCMYCGARMSEKAAFCTACGAKQT